MINLLEYTSSRTLSGRHFSRVLRRASRSISEVKMWCSWCQFYQPTSKEWQTQRAWLKSKAQIEWSTSWITKPCPRYNTPSSRIQSNMKCLTSNSLLSNRLDRKVAKFTSNLYCRTLIMREECTHETTKAVSLCRQNWRASRRSRDLNLWKKPKGQLTRISGSLRITLSLMNLLRKNLLRMNPRLLILQSTTRQDRARTLPLRTRVSTST